MTPLHPKAKELLRLAKSAQEPTPAEVDLVLSQFERRVSTSRSAFEDDAPVRESFPVVSGVSPTLLRRVSRRGRLHVLRWSLMAAIMTGSLGAFANWALVVQQVRHTFTVLFTEVLDLGASSSAPPKSMSRVRSSHPTPLGAPLGPAPGAAASAGAVSGSAASESAVSSEAPAVVDFERVELAPQPKAPLVPETQRAENARPSPERKAGKASLLSPHPTAQESSASGKSADEALAGVQATSQPPDAVTQEVNLIANARAALSSGNYLLTRRLLAEHHASFPHGTLTEERETLSAITACRESGNAEPARRYVARRPQSLFAARLRRECGLAP